MLNICWQSYHLCLKILAVVSLFWNSYINFILYLIQSWTKIVGTLVHNSVFFRYSISILPSPPFNVALLWTRRANFIAYHVWLQHWFRGVGSVKCPSINGQKKDVEAHIHPSPSNHLKIIEGFRVTSYQANFARHPPSDHHVGFLSLKSGKGKFNKMSLNFFIWFKSQYHYHTTTEWQEY